MGHDIRRCGANRWWIDDARLHVRRERGVKRVLKGVAALALSAGLSLFLVKAGSWDPQGLLAVALSLAYGLQRALGVWEVSLDRVRGKVSWVWGLGVPMLRWSRRVADFDRVRLFTQEQSPARDVRLIGPGRDQLVARGADPDEVFALAEAVVRHVRLGLQVGTGRVRPPGELDSPERARALAQLSARLQGVGEGSALEASRSEPIEVPEPPPGCRVRVHEEDGQWRLILPEPGWVNGFRFQFGMGVVTLMLTLGAGGYLLSLTLETVSLLMVMPFVLVLGLFGARFMWKAMMGAITTCHLSVSRPGLAVERSTSGLTQPLRIPAQLIRDVDVRDHSEGAPLMNLFDPSTCPMLIIDRYDGKQLTLGAGLPREELEWAAALVRQRLAREAEARRQESLPEKAARGK
ncbi:hypothetical protein JRI60_01240 [Archangium violaceum]|uniref:hypothetical protein n=1 Tax=Archangium violaceum TaxID=83451 RepID=UPI0019502335|nr:hypothetical protein [Archangium violaceum]QRN97741.1 hypothetical protein JRI60_01240 [Archangium violaceum]